LYIIYKMTDESYKCIISVGMRCFTEIFLKALGYKQFSGPFDAIFSSSIESIIDIFKNKFDENDLIYTEDLQHIDIIKQLNEKHGFRTIHTRYNYDKTNLFTTYHKALLPHHNLKNNEVKDHFARCFNRIDNLKKNQYKTLFCLFMHPDYANDGDISFKDIETVRNYLIDNFNCDLLVCRFKSTTHHYKWNILYNQNNIIYIHINNSSHIFEDNEIVLHEIFDYLKIEKSNLLTYNDIEI